MRGALFVASLGLSVSACVSALERVAAHDLDCPQSRVDVDEVSENTAYASGCGRQLTYRKECRAWSASNAWGSNEAAVCRWERGGSSLREAYEEPGWDSQYRGATAAPPQPSWPRESSSSGSVAGSPSVSQPAPPTPAPPTRNVREEATKTSVVIADLGDLKEAETTLRRWVGQPVRLALSNGRAFEGVLQYVRTFTLWFADGTQHRIEDILAAEKLAIVP